MSLIRTSATLSVAVTLVCGLFYAALQQSYRQSLNDPQIQMAEDAAAKLTAGDVPASVVPRGDLVDISTSLSPWISVYDSSGLVLESSGALSGLPPTPPRGIFRDIEAGVQKGSSTAGENRITWQPEPDVRQALVIVSVSYGKYYVVAGRNMSEVENRISSLGLMMFIGWFIALFVTLVTVLFVSGVGNHTHNRTQ